MSEAGNSNSSSILRIITVKPNRGSSGGRNKTTTHTSIYTHYVQYSNRKYTFGPPHYSTTRESSPDNLTLAYLPSSTVVVYCILCNY